MSNASSIRETAALPVRAATAAAIAGPLGRLLELFHAELADVKFPGIDRAVLDEAADRVGEAALQVAQAEAMLQAARARLADMQEQLEQKGQRALAYARIYAEELPALASQLDAIGSLGGAHRPGVSESVDGAAEAPRRRGRPRKSEPASLLFSPREKTAEPSTMAALETMPEPKSPASLASV